MKTLLASQEASRQSLLESGKLSDVPRTQPAASKRQQEFIKNPVILTLRRLNDWPPEADRQATDRLRIAHEVIQHLGWQKAPPPPASDGSAVWAFRERSSNEQVLRTRAELDAYLNRSRRNKAPLPHHAPQKRRPSYGLARNPVLDAIRLSESPARLADYSGVSKRD